MNGMRKNLGQVGVMANPVGLAKKTGVELKNRPSIDFEKSNRLLSLCQADSACSRPVTTQFLRGEDRSSYGSFGNYDIRSYFP